MCYIEIIEEEFLNKRWNRISKRKLIKYKCDECNIIYTGGYKANCINNDKLTLLLILFVGFGLRTFSLLAN